MVKMRVGMRLCRVVVLTLLALMLLAGVASAAEVNSMGGLQNRINANDGNIVLTGNIQVTQTLNIGRGKNIRIDLNGYQLSRGGNLGTMFSVNNGGSLTITDSRMAAAAETVLTRTPSRDTNTADGTGIALPTQLNNGTLTYYESRSAVNADGITTTETRYVNTVNVGNMGRIVSGNTSNAALIQVSGSDSVLTIEGGAFSNTRGRVIEASGAATLNLTGGYFYHSTAGNGMGGAVYISGYSGKVTANIGGVQGREIVFAGNSASNGGALATEGNVALNIHNGAVFTGNQATGQGRNGGGAIFVGYDSDAVMNGGLVTNNWCTMNTNYEAGGGGMLIRGTLMMTNGQVTHNEAAGGGGISTVFWDGGVMTIRGGFVSGNVARVNEGGGITVNMNGSATIVGTAQTATYITNNATETNQHWGGGGIFAADQSTLRMLSVVITENEAGGFGGGLAGCSTGRIDTHALNIEDHSVALYGNSAEGVHLSGNESTKSEDRVYAANDPVFMREGAYYQDYFCALNTTVCSGMLGGGKSMWTGTVDGRAITPADVGENERITSQYITGLTGDPSAADIAKGLAKGLVFVTGNSSGTHGGGILCNGYMIVGTQNEIEIGDRMTIKGDKTVSGGTVHDEFTFIVTDDEGNRITTGTSQSNSEIVFNGRIPFDEPGTYTFWIYEADENIPDGVKMDQTRYRMVVTVTTTRQNTSAPSATDPTQMETIYVHFNKISSVAIYKCADANDKVGTRVANYTSISSDNRNAYDLPFEFEFVNRVSKDTGIVVSKTVHDLSGQSSNATFTFTVTLDNRNINGTKGDMTFVNGVATFTLKAGQSLRAIELPANTRYTVVETPTNGYHIENYNRVGTTVQDVVQSVVFENMAVGSLKIKKTVAGSGATDFDRNRVFTFRVTLTNGNNINGPYGPVIFENGVAYVELKHGEEVTILNLPAGTTYEVKEETSEGFDPNETTQGGTIAIGQTSTADFINTRKTGELHIKKYVIDSDYDGERFDFSIELIDAAHINGTYGDATFVNGKATVSLGHGETARITGLPTGLGYTVDEMYSDAYSGHYAVGVVGNSSGSIGDAPAIIEYTNEKFAGLEIRKDVSGTVADRSREFTFELTLSNDTATLADTYGGLTFVNGKATFTLRDGEYVVLTGLPDGTRYTVRELGVDADLYRVEINDVTSQDYTISGVLNSGDSEAADFHNFRQAGALELSKTTSSPVERDSERVFEFIVTVSEPINTRLGDFLFVNGVAHVFLKDGQTLRASNLPAGMTYTIAETPNADFDSSVSSGKASDTIVAGQTSSVTFHNQRRLGNLKIRKVVEDNAASATDVFGFKITLDRELNGTFGDVTFTEGVGTFQLVNGQTIQINNLPEHTVFTIIETTFDALKYRPVVGSIQGDIDYQDTKEFDFHNEVLGALVVSKTVEGTNRNDTFTFTVTLDDTSINGVYGDMTFVNGVATFTLKHGEYMVATHLPDDVVYTVEEEPHSDYETTVPANASGSIVAHQIQQVAFLNTFKTGSLEVKKTIAGDGANMAEKFTFTVLLSDATISGTYGDMTFESGMATFQLGHNESATATRLPAGLTYTVTESNKDYTVTSTGATGTIVADSVANADFVNTKMLGRGGLTVTKTITGDGADMAEKFTFTVLLSDTTISGTYGDMTFENGVATFQLGHNESATATRLPAGLTYTVTESNKDYTVTSTGATGTIVVDATVNADFVNNKMMARGALTVTKKITGDGADKKQKFTFRVTLNDTTINGVYGDMTFENGVATFQLGHNESATATRLPAGLTYKVEELDAADYKVTSSKETGMIVGDQTIPVTFTNHRDKIEIPETGDQTPLAFYVVMMAMAAAALGMLKHKARKA